MSSLWRSFILRSRFLLSEPFHHMPAKRLLIEQAYAAVDASRCQKFYRAPVLQRNKAPPVPSMRHEKTDMRKASDLTAKFTDVMLYDDDVMKKD